VRDHTVRENLERGWAGMAEDSANRTHQRLQQPPNGFEDRPEHQSRLPSIVHCSGKAGKARSVAAKGSGRVHWNSNSLD
jgi:hypothetical protein